MCVENVLNGTDGIYKNHLFRENVLDGTESWFLTMAWVYPPQPVRKVGISNYNLPPARLWKGWNRLIRHFSDGLPPAP